jgi:ribonuclease PH
MLDLEYEEDHRAAVDCNLVAAMPMDNEDLEIVEFQSTGEGRSFLRDEALSILDLGLLGCQRLMVEQSEVLG